MNFVCVLDADELFWDSQIKTCSSYTVKLFKTKKNCF
jgi:hypothetical protein